ncbi:2-oxo-4-hydroxy-4-carboxy-5-ureidoimidazoline decarboxylase [Marinobacter sp.]|jgi:2-oxo-4-hydroxy-4-carboxy-5-ureidoimidazoline decarboxylase|uniref:2-oxo-4-hydroxy-4-carboxy-5-ureidoimidazoline decarboxylase n=1 Tax=Marinobacter sp. TaxID=50741 RepID=UPI0019CCB146|nr:2-oxo-4-hydroxy-4-carboxy-5-ureidoimidazoline decarboxylase [Marinobacter sp.]MBC7193794.1 2-oxo-4-hydroxy-4-carboxy-5-ureidoimidazoline decarboxylase [Marinobacter sp.]
MSLETINALPRQQAEDLFRDCCAAGPWVQGMVENRPYASREAMLAQSRQLWPSLTERDWLQAFEAHPTIGDVDSLRKKYASTKALASGEQAGALGADEDLLRRLKQGNDAYLEKFGFIFIVCATGRSASEMLALLEARLPNSREVELKNAAREQAKITEIRLEKLA